MKQLLFFRLSTATALSTAIWTPPANKRFQLMGWLSMISPGSTSAAGSIIYLQDGADFMGYINHVQIAANPTVIMQSVNLPDDGYISSADNQALNLYLSSALTAGTVKIMVWGYEI